MRQKAGTPNGPRAKAWQAVKGWTQRQGRRKARQPARLQRCSLVSSTTTVKMTRSPQNTALQSLCCTTQAACSVSSWCRRRNHLAWCRVVRANKARPPTAPMSLAMLSVCGREQSTASHQVCAPRIYQRNIQCKPCTGLGLRISLALHVRRALEERHGLVDAGLEDVTIHEQPAAVPERHDS